MMMTATCTDRARWMVCTNVLATFWKFWIWSWHVCNARNESRLAAATVAESKTCLNSDERLIHKWRQHMARSWWNQFVRSFRTIRSFTNERTDLKWQDHDRKSRGTWSRRRGALPTIRVDTCSIVRLFHVWSSGRLEWHKNRVKPCYAFKTTTITTTARTRIKKTHVLWTDTTQGNCDSSRMSKQSIDQGIN